MSALAAIGFLVTQQRSATSDAGGGLPAPPSGFAYLVDSNGKYIVDENGAYILTEI